MNTINRCALLALTLGFCSGAAHARRPRFSQAALAPPAASRAAVPVVTRDNFVALSVRTSGGIANLHTSITVTNSSISRSKTQTFFGGPFGGGAIGGGAIGGGGSFLLPGGGAGWQKFQFGGGSFGGRRPYSGPADGFGPASGLQFASSYLSGNQLNAVLRILNEARFPALSGKYRQKNLADGINETLTLTISDEANRDRTFTIENTGDGAPRAYSQMMDRLRAFVALKFPEPAAAAVPASSAPAQNPPAPTTPPYYGGAQ